MPNPTLRYVLCVAFVAAFACDGHPSNDALYPSDGGLEDGALEQTSLASTAPGEPLSPVECRAAHPVVNGPYASFYELSPQPDQPDPDCDRAVSDAELPWNRDTLIASTQTGSRDIAGLTRRDLAAGGVCRGAWRTTDFPTPSLYASRAVVTRRGVGWTLTSPASSAFPHGTWTPTTPSDVCDATRNTHLTRFRSANPLSTVLSTYPVATARVVTDRHPFRDGAGGANTTATFDCHVVSHFRTSLRSPLPQNRWVNAHRVGFFSWETVLNTRAAAEALLASEWRWTYQDNDRFTPVASAIPPRPRPVGATWACSTCDQLSAEGTDAHACLITEHDRVPASDLATRRAIANRALLSFEAYGHLYTPAQRTEVRNIRRSDPSRLLKNAAPPIDVATKV